MVIQIWFWLMPFSYKYAMSVNRFQFVEISSTKSRNIIFHFSRNCLKEPSNFKFEKKNSQKFYKKKIKCFFLLLYFVYIVSASHWYRRYQDESLIWLKVLKKPKRIAVQVLVMQQLACSAQQCHAKYMSLTRIIIRLSKDQFRPHQPQK